MNVIEHKTLLARLKFYTVLLMLGLGGCTTCERHPVYCSVGLGVVATSIALSVNHGGGGNTPSHISVSKPNCANGSCQ